MTTTVFADTSERDELLGRARATLEGNDVGPFVKPGRTQYPHQWNWDAALVALGFSHFDLPRGQHELRMLLKGQWRDGMLPHVVYHTGESDYFPTPDFWRIEESPHAPLDVSTSGIVQPPLIVTCVRMMHERAVKQGDASAETSREFVREVYPSLLRMQRWHHHARDLHRTGLVSIIHPWESGTDNAARWVEPMIRIRPRNMPAYRRRDMHHVKADERPIHTDYERFIYLIDLFRRWAYDPETIYAKSPFLVQDVLFNAIVHRADEDLLALAELLGEPTDEIELWLRRTRRAMNGKLWDDDEGLYYAYDARDHRLLRENGCATFIPLFAGLPDVQQADQLVHEHLLNPEEYAPDAKTQFYLPSQAKDNYFFEPRRYWRGPVWMIINWMVLVGLERYGYDDLATTFRTHSLQMLKQSGFVEYYDPRDGTGAGATDFSWSAALAFEFANGPS